MAGTTEAALKRESARIRINLDNPNRYFAYTKEAKDSYDKEYNYVNGDIKLAQFANDVQGIASDCYILYAVASLGCTDLEGIRLFLSAMSNKYKDLSISNMADVSSVRNRIRGMMQSGMLFKHRYVISAAVEDEQMLDSVKTEGGSERSISNKVVLYTITKSAQTLANHKLGRRTVIDDWIQAKPLYELMGIASCSYVAGRIAHNKAYIEQSQGVYSTKIIGTVFMASELEMACANNDRPAYVGFIPAFLHFDKSIKTAEVFEEDCRYLVKRMHQYLYSRDLSKDIARLVVVVEDNSDLVQIAKRISMDEKMPPNYDRVYFTGEGVVRQAKTSKLEGCFLQMVQDNSENGYSFVPARPDFIL